jgi:uncharacterized protein YndB with AHSA1/START domain
MSVRIEQCEWFDAPPDTVWRAVEDITTHVDWMRDAVEIRPRTERLDCVGAEFECLTRVGPLTNRDVLRVTEWQPGAVMGIEHTGSVKGSARFLLTPERDGTRFCWEELLTFPWWMGGALGERAAKPVLGRIWRANLRRLKERVEAPGSPG